MKNDVLISVIIPVYNVEEYINDCINSIINQTYKKLEILIIDDKGDDDSINIVKQFSKNDSRIKILSYQKNMGVSFARNYGLKYANGQYIYFLDSDDFINLNYLEEMFKNIENYDIIQNNKWIEYISAQNFNIVNYKNEISVNIWNKLYKKEFLIKNDIKFPSGIKIGEDLCFNYLCLSLTNKIKYSCLNTAYFYRYNKNSTVNKFKKNNDILDVFYILYDILKNNNSLNKLSLPFHHLRRHLKNSDNKNKMFSEIKDFFIKIQPFINENKNQYKKKDLLFFNCVLKSNHFYLYLIKFTIIKLFN